MTCEKEMSVTDNENSKQVAKVSINFPDDNLMKAGLDFQGCFESVLRGNCSTNPSYKKFAKDFVTKTEIFIKSFMEILFHH